jgi:hypothetical protein
MQATNQIREIIKKFVDQPNDVESFISAFSSASFNIHKKGEPAAIKLVNEVEACLADVRAGFASSSDLHKCLRDLLTPAPVGYYYVAVATFSQSVNLPAVVEREFPAASSDTLPAAVFGLASPVRA